MPPAVVFFGVEGLHDNAIIEGTEINLGHDSVILLVFCFVRERDWLVIRLRNW